MKKCCQHNKIRNKFPGEWKIRYRTHIVDYKNKFQFKHEKKEQRKCSKQHFILLFKGLIVIAQWIDHLSGDARPWVRVGTVGLPEKKMQIKKKNKTQISFRQISSSSS